jgi:hypothetical protein
VTWGQGHTTQSEKIINDQTFVGKVERYFQSEEVVTERMKMNFITRVQGVRYMDHAMSQASLHGVLSHACSFVTGSRKRSTGEGFSQKTTILSCQYQSSGARYLYFIYHQSSVILTIVSVVE